MRNRLHTALLLLLILVLPMQAQVALGMPQAPATHAECSMRMDHGGMAKQVQGASHPHFKPGTCSLCALCVSAMALVQPLVPPRDGVGLAPASMASPRLSGVILDTPERPPRHLSF